MGQEPAVYVETLAEYSALKMTWQSGCNIDDIRDAFGEIMMYLNGTQEPLHIIVDLTKEPMMPVEAMTNYCLMGPQVHPMMGKWFMVGDNPGTHKLAVICIEVSNRDNFVWFDTMQEAEDFLSELKNEGAETI